MSNNQQESYELRLEKVLFIISHPESLLTDDTQSWLTDKENRKFYQQLLAVKEKALAETQAQHFDTKAAWEKFSQEHPTLLQQKAEASNASDSASKTFHLFHNWRKWTVAAAISIPIILLASIAPIYHFTHQTESEETVIAQEQSHQQASFHPTRDAEATDSLPSESGEEEGTAYENNYFHFENAPLEDIMREVAAWYKMGVIFENEQARQLRFTFWASKQAPASQTVELLNEMGKVKFTIKDNQIIIQ